jgi:hypothetical protein
MTLLPVADTARLLGIHPKTLHHWLKEAQIPLVTHPTDARIKCVSEEHLDQVASLHGRSRPAPDRFHPASPSLVPPPGSIPYGAEHEGESPFTACSFLVPNGSEAGLTHKLSDLETRVTTLQEQLAQLSLALLKAQERAIEYRLTALEALLQPLVEKQGSAPSLLEIEQAPPRPLQKPRPLHPVEQLARSRIPPLIECSAQGMYVIISAQEGEVQVQPDSRAWFDWLATLSSFRFVGPVGRFTGHRGYKDGQQTRYWSASRCVRRHTYKHYLGMTESLTIVNLERTAAALQADIDAR